MHLVAGRQRVSGAGEQFPGDRKLLGIAFPVRIEGERLPPACGHRVVEVTKIRISFFKRSPVNAHAGSIRLGVEPGGDVGDPIGLDPQLHAVALPGVAHVDQRVEAVDHGAGVAPMDRGVETVGVPHEGDRAAEAVFHRGYVVTHETGAGEIPVGELAVDDNFSRSGWGVHPHGLGALLGERGFDGGEGARETDGVAEE